MSGLARPDGPVRIEGTEMRSRDVLVARLSGAANGVVAVVRRGRRYRFVAPASMGGARTVEAVSLTDALHASVEEMSARIGGRGKGGGCGGKKR